MGVICDFRARGRVFNLRIEFLLWRNSAQLQINVYLPNISIWLCIPSSVARMRREKETVEKERREEEEGKQTTELQRITVTMRKTQKLGGPPPTPQSPSTYQSQETRRSIQR